jgi:hypothetical protein
MQRDSLKKALNHLGIPREDYRVLKLLPLIYVAWADGKMERVKKERIHAYAAKHYELGANAMRVLNDWLTTAPTHQYIHEGLHDLYLLALAEDDIEIDFSELPALLSYAEGVARSSDEALDAPESVSPAADVALEEVARELHIDHGESWAKLLRELGTAAEPSPRASAGTP